MKKITFVFLFLFLSMGKMASSAVVMVGVENFTFNPATITVNVGDTIMWMWMAGTHTTTSTNGPVGAIPWDAAINQANPMFMYQVTVEGEYDYQCNFHFSMGMVGHISVLGSSGISKTSLAQFEVIGNLVQRDLAVKFNSGKNWNIELRSLTGSLVKQFTIASEAGRTELFPVAELPNGIYIVRFFDGQAVRSQRIIKQ